MRIGFGDETEKEYKTIGLRRHQRSKRFGKIWLTQETDAYPQEKTFLDPMLRCRILSNALSGPARYSGTDAKFSIRAGPSM